MRAPKYFLLLLMTSVAVSVFMPFRQAEAAKSIKFSELPTPLFYAHARTLQEIETVAGEKGKKCERHKQHINKDIKTKEIKPNNIIYVPNNYPDQFPDLIIASDQYNHDIKPTTPTWLFCDAGTAALFPLPTTLPPPPVQVEEESVIAKIVRWLVYLVALVGVWLLTLVSSALTLILGKAQFTTDPYVQNGWPFIQGIANFGYIMALLYIAFVTVLGLEGYNVRRLIPRLLIAALLTNFSLVFTGIIIDASRLVMAAILSMFKTGNLGLGLIQGSDIITLVFNIVQNDKEWRFTLVNNPAYWSEVLKVIQATFLIWAMVLALIVVTVGFFIRRVVLLLLLIASPVAFLGFAFPGLNSLAQRWWQSFIKYVLYGPVAIFVLALLVTLNSKAGPGIRGGDFVDSFLSVAFTVAICFAAYKFGKSISGFGADAAIGLSKKAPGFAWRNPGKAGMIAAGVAGGGIPAIIAGGIAAKLGRGGAAAAGGAARDFGGYAKQAFVGRIRKTPGLSWMAPIRRDKEGKPLEGQTSVGQSAGRAMFGWVSPRERAQQAEAAAARSSFHGAHVAGDYNTPELSAINLQEEHVLRNLGSDKTQSDKRVRILARKTDSAAQVKAVANNKGYLRTLNTKERADLEKAMRKNTIIKDSEKQKALDSLLRNIKEILAE